MMHGVQYYQPVEAESIRHNKKRRKLMRSEINSKRAREAMPDDDIDFVVELAVSIPGLLVDKSVLYVQQSIVNHIVNDEVPSDRKELHANPKVHEMVAVFTDGKLKQQVATCQCCNEIRSQFHSTMPSDKFKSERRKPQEVPYWKIFKDGLCERCHKESYRRKKGNNVMTFCMTSAYTRGHAHKLFKHHAIKRTRIDSFSQRIVNTWNSLPAYVINAPSINQFKNRLDRHWKVRN